MEEHDISYHKNGEVTERLSNRIWLLPLKLQEKMHLKMLSAEVVCFKYLPYIT